MVHCWATDTDDPTEQPRWGKIGKQKIVDEGPLPPFPNMEGRQNWQKGQRPSTTWRLSTKSWSSIVAFMDKAKKDGKPFFVWHNTTRMHVFTFLSAKYQAMMNSKTNYGLEEAGMAQLDDIVGALMKQLDDMGEADNTILVFTTDNGAEVFTWPDGGMTPFKGNQGHGLSKAVSACPASSAGRARSSRARVENGIFSGLDWFPTLVAAAGNPNITDNFSRA